LHRRPVVFPRRAAFGEIVNDHQLELCQEMAQKGRIFLAEDKQGLFSAIAQAIAQSSEPPPPSSSLGGDRLRGQIASLLRQIASRR
jgi:UDP-N-acetylglucosamine transferase subunit ALG13